MKKTSLLLSLLFPALMMMGQISAEQLSYANMPICDAEIEVFAEGTAGPFTVRVTQYDVVVFSLTPIPEGEGSIIVPGLCDGKHIIEVTNRFGCTTSMTELLARCEFRIKDTQPNKEFPSACGAEDGSIRFFTSPLVGGTGNITYTWTNQEGEIIPPAFPTNGLYLDQIGSSIYTLSVEDENGCIATADYDLLSENEPNVYGEPTVSCEGEDNGVVSVAAYMPAANMPNGYPVNFYWSTGVVEENVRVSIIDNLSPDTYSVTISDAQGICSVERSYVVEERASTGPFTYTSSISPSCASDNNGSIDLQATGGNPPYEYRWDTWAVFGPSRSELAGGTYCVTITDDCDREIMECFDIALPEPEIDIAFAINCEDVTERARGWLVSAVDGGVPPFSYAWSNSNSQNSGVSVFGNGLYTLTVTDGNNCEHITSYDLTLPSIQVSDFHEPCEGFYDGEITVLVANPFDEEVNIVFDNGLEYQFGQGEEMHTFSNLEGGINYRFTVSIGECVLMSEKFLKDKPTEKVFNGDIEAAANTGICTFDEECDGEPIDEDSYFSEVNYELYEAQGEFLGDCFIPGFCGDTEVTTKDYDKLWVRAFEYEQVLVVASTSSGWSPSIVLGHMLRFRGKNLENCDLVKYCPATLQLLQTLDTPFTGNGNVVWTPEGCLELTCSAIFKTEFCPNEDVPDYFSTFEGELPPPPVIPDGCSPRRLKVVQLLAWDYELEQNFGDEYLMSTLKAFVNQVNNPDNNYGYLTNCAEVLFCRDEFEFISSDIDEVSCLDDIDDVPLITCDLTEQGDGSNWYIVNCVDPSCLCLETVHLNLDYPDNDFFSIPDDHQIKVIEGTIIRPSSFVNLGKGIADGRIVGKGLFKDEEDGIYNDFSHRSTIASRINTRNIIEYIIEWDNNEVLYIEQHGANKFQLWREAAGSSWAEVLTSEKMEISHLSKKKDIIYVGGVFEGTLIFGDEKLTGEKKYAGFLLEINEEGQVINRQIVENINPSTDFLIEDGLQGILLSGESQETAIEVNGHFEEMQDGGIFNVKVAAGSVTTNSEMRTQGNIKTKKVIQALEDTKKTYLFKGEGSIGVGGINYTTNARDAAVIKVNANGTRKWFKRFRSTNGGEIKSIDIVSGDHESVYVGLTFTGGLISNRVRFRSKGGEDILIFKLDDRGKVIDYKQYGTIEDERIMELLYDSGTLYFGGEFSGQESDRLIGRIKYVNHSNTYNNAYVSYLFDSDFEKGATTRSEEDDTIEELEKAMIAMPNPFSDQVTIEVNDETIVQLAIYNTLGEEVASSSVTTGRAWKVDFSNIPKGLYILQATDEKGRTIAVESIVHQ